MDWNNFFPGILLVIFGLFGMLFGHTGLAVEALLEGLEGVSAFMFMFGLILIIPSILKGGSLPSIQKPSVVIDISDRIKKQGEEFLNLELPDFDF